MIFDVDNLGIETLHSKGWCHELPQGFPFWIFLHMVTPHLANEGDGEMHLAAAGACIVYPPNTPRYLYCPEGQENLCNTWIHFSVSDNDAFAALLDGYGIPINHFFMLRQTAPLVSSLQELIYEHSLAQPNKTTMLTLLAHIMLIQISRNLLPYDTQVNPTALQHLHDFERLRKQLYTSPEKEWTVDDMAGSVFLSPNQFIILYRTFFGVTPKHDLINARIAKAKSLLGSSAILRDVALSCGFKNEYYFSTTFRRVVGIPPSQYGRRA